jgi:hypothetical protein
MPMRPDPVGLSGHRARSGPAEDSPPSRWRPRIEHPAFGVPPTPHLADAMARRCSSDFPDGEMPVPGPGGAAARSETREHEREELGT